MPAPAHPLRLTVPDRRAWAQYEVAAPTGSTCTLDNVREGLDCLDAPTETPEERPQPGAHDHSRGLPLTGTSVMLPRQVASGTLGQKRIA